jgi:hypothetical protein
VSLWVIGVLEPHAPEGFEAIDWMLLTDLPVETAERAREMVQWYCRRLGD